MRFVIFFTVMFSVLALINAYAFRRAVKAFSLSRHARWIVGATLFASLFGMLLGRIADRLWSGAPVGKLLVVASSMQLAVLISFFFLILADAARVLLGLVGRFCSSRLRAATSSGVPDSELARVQPADLPRRAFLEQAAAGSAFLIGGSSALYGTLSGRHDYSIEEVPIKIPGLSRALDGFAIVQLSDIQGGLSRRHLDGKALFAKFRPARMDGLLREEIPMKAKVARAFAADVVRFSSFTRG